MWRAGSSIVGDFFSLCKAGSLGDSLAELYVCSLYPLEITAFKTLSKFRYASSWFRLEASSSAAPAVQW